MNADEILNALGDDALHDIVAEAAEEVGVELTVGEIAKLIELIKQSLRSAVAERERVQRDQEMRAVIHREIQRFYRQIGGRPNGRYQTL